MGMFDRVWVACPRCHEQIEVQSKAGACNLENYTLADVPANIAGALDGDIVACPNGHRAMILTHVIMRVLPV